MLQMVLRCLAWLTYRPAYMLLVASDEALAAQPAHRFARAGGGIMLLGLLHGLLLCGVWSLAWGVFDDFNPLIMPAAATLLVHVVWPLRRSGPALAEVIDRRPGGGMTAAMLVVGLGFCFLSFQPQWYREEFPLPAWLAWIRPEAKFYRALLLMPLWGVWSMLIMPQFCRPGERTEPALAACARGCGPMTTALSLSLPLAGTIFYFHYMGPWAQGWISALTVVTAIAGSFVLCRLSGGLRRHSWLALNVLTQIVFLLTYLAHSRLR